MLLRYITKILLFFLTLLQNTLHEGVQEKILHVDIGKTLGKNVYCSGAEEDHSLTSWHPFSMYTGRWVHRRAPTFCRLTASVAKVLAPSCQPHPTWQPFQVQTPHLIHMQCMAADTELFTGTTAAKPLNPLHSAASDSGGTLCSPQNGRTWQIPTQALQDQGTHSPSCWECRQ